jgi:hypothetical protein
MPRNPWTVGFGLVLIATGIVWMVDNVVDIDIAWNWVVPGLLILLGIGCIVGREDRTTPTQFERDDAPRVP